MNQAQSVARAAIADTLSRYVMGVDYQRYDEVGACFTEDGVFHMSKTNPPTGREAIRKRLGEGRPRGVLDEPGIFQRHNLTSSVIDFVSETEATARTYVFVVTELGFDHSAIYFDRLVQVGDKWLIKERRGQVDHMRPDSRFARSVAKAQAEPAADPA